MTVAFHVRGPSDFTPVADGSSPASILRPLGSKSATTALCSSRAEGHAGAAELPPLHDQTGAIGGGRAGLYAEYAGVVDSRTTAAKPAAAYGDVDLAILVGHGTLVTTSRVSLALLRAMGMKGVPCPSPDLRPRRASLRVRLHLRLWRGDGIEEEANR